MTTNESGKEKSWFRRKWNLVVVVLVIIMLVVYAVPRIGGPSQAPSADQAALNRSIYYFARFYDLTTGLMPETPNGTTFWLYSDNYLSSLAISRYSSSNQSTMNFATSLHYLVEGYASTFDGGNISSQYAALNSSVASFNCSNDYALSWSRGGGNPPAGSGARTIETTANDGNGACATLAQNYADLLFLQAIYYHKSGNAAHAASFYQAGARDFDGIGIADSAYSDPSSSSYHVYQTYKLALYLYAVACTGQRSTDTNFSLLNSTLLSLQDKATGGFFTGYYPTPATHSTGVNTETTALATLAIELVISPSASC